MPYWRIFCHLVWGTKLREPILIGNIAKTVDLSFRESAEDMKVAIHAMYLMPDHIHLAISIPPALSIATAVQRFKGASSYAVNHADSRDHVPFAWQTEYGAVSFGEKQLADVVAYIEHQPERHASNRLWDRIERIDESS